MLEPTGDYLQKRAKQLGLSRGDVLDKIQLILEDYYPDQTRAVSLNNGVLRLATPSASVASELRLKQVELLRHFRVAAGEYPVNNLQIQIRG